MWIGTDLTMWFALLLFLLTLDPPKQQTFYGLPATAEIGTGLLLAPLVIASLGILVIPIRLVRRPKGDSWVVAQGSEELPASTGLRALLGAAAFFQQASIFMFLHVILRLTASVDLPGVILTG